MLVMEISDAQDEAFAGEIVVGAPQFHAMDPPQVFEDITLSPEFPLLSTIIP